MDSSMEGYQTFGWTPQSSLSRDDNFLDLLLLLTRNSNCRDGGMGCILVHDDDSTTKILGAATNRPLYSTNDSDVHAEVAAIGTAARLGRATAGCTAYVTMPPCKRCLGALIAAGVHRLVFFRTAPDYLQTVAQQHDLVWVEVPHSSERRARIETLIAQHHRDNGIDGKEEIDRKRQQRKEEEKERKRKRKLELGVIQEDIP